MKGLGKILVGVMVLTSLLLFYVHQRVEILRVSYRIHTKSSQLAQRTEEFRRLKFEVDRMRSPDRLQKRLEDMSLPFTLPKQIEVLQVPESVPSVSEANPLPRDRQAFFPNSSSDSFVDFLGRWIQIAQARTEQ